MRECSLEIVQWAKEQYALRMIHTIRRKALFKSGKWWFVIISLYVSHFRWHQLPLDSVNIHWFQYFRSLMKRWRWLENWILIKITQIKNRNLANKFRQTIKLMIFSIVMVMAFWFAECFMHTNISTIWTFNQKPLSMLLHAIQ